MAKPTALRCAQRAQEVYDKSVSTKSPIPYVEGKETLNPAIGADCQGWVEAIIRDLGGKISYAGTNEMWRKAASWFGTIDEARKQGKLVPGCCPIIIKQDGKEPDKYKPGGSMYDPNKIGNCSHIGWYIGGKYEVIDASYSRGTVSPTTLKGGFTHIIWMKEVDYTESGSSSGGSNEPYIPDNKKEDSNMEENKGTERLHWVILPMDKMGQSVNFRKFPDMKSDTIVLARLSAGTQVLAGDEFIEGGRAWKAVNHNGMNGYMLAEFLEDISDTNYVPYIPEDGEPAREEEAYIPQNVPQSTEVRLMMLERGMVKVLGTDWYSKV